MTILPGGPAQCQAGPLMSLEEKYLQNYCCQLMSAFRVSFTTNFLILKPSMTRQSSENYVTIVGSERTNISLLTTLISDRSDTIKPLSRLEMQTVWSNMRGEKRED